VRSRPQIIDFQCQKTTSGQESIGFLQIAGELGIIGDMVVQLRREKVQTIVTLAGFARIFLNRQQLYRVDSEILQIVNTIEQIEKLADGSPFVPPFGINCIIDTDMELVLNQIAKRRWAKVGIVPRIAAWVSYQAIAIGI